MTKKEEKEELNAIGRPTKFKPEYCEMLITHMAKGFSFRSFAAIIEVNVDTLYAWSDKKSDQFKQMFSDAKKLGKAKSLYLWEQIGLEGVWDVTETEKIDNKTITKSKKLNASVYIFSMKNKHGWTDKSKQEIQNERPITLAYSPKEKNEN